MIEKLKHRDAFEYYYALGESRTQQEVANRFKCSKRAVEKWSVAFQWQKRIVERDNEIADLVSDKLKKHAADQKVKYHNLVQNLIAPVIKGLQYMRLENDQQKKEFREKNPDMVEIKATNILDFERLIKLDLLLLGENTSNIGVTEYKTIAELIKNASKSS